MTRIARGDEKIKELPLDPTPPISVIQPEREGSFLYYTFMSFDKYYSSDVDFRDEYDTEGGGLHRISLGGRESDGKGRMISFGFSDEIELSGKGTTYLGGYGDIYVQMERYEFDFVGFQSDKEYNNHIGFKFIHIERDYDYRRISGFLNSQSFDIKSDYIGLFYGFGANNPLFNETWITFYWSVQLMGMWGFMDEMEVGFDGQISQVKDYSGSGERTSSLVGGVNGAAGIQIHLNENSSIGVGYKGQYLEGGDMEDTYIGWMASAILRF